jgi:hypothetical protein
MKTKQFTLLIVALSSMIILRSQAQTPGFGWAKQAAGDTINYGRGIAIDSYGNQIINGVFYQNIDLDNDGVTDFTSQGKSDIFIQKSDPEGNLLWAYAMGDYSNDLGFDVVTDESDNIYITGYFWGTIDADPDPDVQVLLSQDRITTFVIKYSPDGSLAWAKQFGSGNMGHAEGISIKLDASGNVFISGIFYGKVDFDPGPGAFYMNSAIPAWDGFIEKLDPNGNFIWAKQITGAGIKMPYSMKIYDDNNIYACGYFSGTVDFNPDRKLKYNLTSYGNQDAFILKLNESGGFVWAKQVGGTANDGTYNIALDNNGNPLIAGWFYGTADFDPGSGTYPMDPFGQSDVYILKLSYDGNFMWAKQYGGPSFENSSDIQIDGSGNIYVAGYFYGTADFDPGYGTFQLTSNGNDDSFVLKTNSGGDLIWVTQTGGPGWDWSLSAALDSDGNIFNVGKFEVTADFDPNGDGEYNISCSNEYGDMFIQKLTPDGGSNCEVPDGLGVVLSNGGTTATLSWNEVYGVGGYYVRYREITAADWIPITEMITGTSYVLNDLLPSTAFEFQVKTYDCESNYSYSYEFYTAEPDCTDTYEPNENMSASAEIPVNTDIFAIIPVYGDKDWFHFQPTAQAKNIRITLSELPVNYDLKLYSGDGTLLGSSTHEGTLNETIIYNSNKVRIYYAVVYGFEGAYDPIHCYTLHVETSATGFKSAEADIPGSETAGNISVYPNPASDILNVDISSDKAASARISLINTSGQIIMAKEFKAVEGLNHYAIDVSAIPNGLYMVRILDNGGTMLKKILINR